MKIYALVLFQPKQDFCLIGKLPFLMCGHHLVRMMRVEIERILVAHAHVTEKVLVAWPACRRILSGARVRFTRGLHWKTNQKIKGPTQYNQPKNLLGGLSSSPRYFLTQEV